MTGGWKRTVGRGVGESDETELGGVGRESLDEESEEESLEDEDEESLESAEELESWDDVRVRGWVSSMETETVGVKPYSKSEGSSSSSL